MITASTIILSTDCYQKVDCGSQLTLVSIFSLAIEVDIESTISAYTASIKTMSKKSGLKR